MRGVKEPAEIFTCTMGDETKVGESLEATEIQL